jgi:ribosomal-protein-alanine N-acetyltransferase
MLDTVVPGVALPGSLSRSFARAIGLGARRAAPCLSRAPGQNAIMNRPLEVPRIAVGDAFLLRPWEIGDLELVREASHDPYIPLITTIPSSFSQEAGEAFVRRQWKRASTGGGYPFVIVRVQDTRPVGAIGLWTRELAEGRAWLGYWLAESARGQGTAAAVLQAITVWGLSDLQIPRLQLCIEPWNAASMRTAERVGFQREGLLRSWQRVGDERRPMVLYSMLRSDLPRRNDLVS